MSLAYPQHNAPLVAAASDELRRLASAETRFCQFLSNYLRSNMERVASNLCVLRGQLKTGSSLLDVGSFGVEPAVLKHEDPGREIAAIAYEENWIHVADGQLVEGSDDAATAVHVQRVDVERERFPFPDDSFDLVSCFEVLEHLQRSPVPMLLEMKRVLKPLGRFVLTTPNLGGTRATLKQLAGEPPQEVPHYHQSLDYGVIHPKEYTPPEMQELFSAMGFAELSIVSHSFRKSFLSERLLSGALRTMRFLAKLGGKPSHAVLPGDNFVVTGAKGGPVIDAWPSRIFQKPN